MDYVEISAGDSDFPKITGREAAAGSLAESENACAEVTRMAVVTVQQQPFLHPNNRSRDGLTNEFISSSRTSSSAPHEPVHQGVPPPNDP